MRLVKLGCEGYKPFREQTEIVIRPLTIFFGKNNSGKTVLLRLPRLLLRALSSRARGNFPLEVDDISFGESFTHLVHQGLVHGHAAFVVELEDEGKVLSLAATVQNISESPPAPGSATEYQVVSKFRLAEPPLVLEWEGRRGRPAHYRGFGPIAFRGLLPESRDGVPLPSAFVEDWRRRVRDAEDRICHLGAQRTMVTRNFEHGKVRPLGLDGSGVLSWLAEWPALVRSVGDWYEEHMDGWRLSLDTAGAVSRCVLRRGTVEVNLADAGQGMQQVLSVVVQQLVHRGADRSSFFDVVEEPELHLHPAAHAPLADLFLETARGGHGQVLVETHSENLLLRVRRRIAEGADPDLVALYWVEDRPQGDSIVRPVRVLDDGEVDYWPEGVFSEGYQEVRALRRAARPRADAELPE